MDQPVDLPVLSIQGMGITEADVYEQACQIYAKLVSVPRTIQHEQLLELAFQQQGYANATHAYRVGAVEAALHIKEMVEKELANNDGSKP